MYMNLNWKGLGEKLILSIMYKHYMCPVLSFVFLFNRPRSQPLGALVNIPHLLLSTHGSTDLKIFFCQKWVLPKCSFFHQRTCSVSLRGFKLMSFAQTTNPNHIFYPLTGTDCIGIWMIEVKRPIYLDVVCSDFIEYMYFISDFSLVFTSMTYYKDSRLHQKWSLWLAKLQMIL